jgi:hypothetical protein
MEDKELEIGKFYTRLQLKKSFMAKKWCFVRNGYGWIINIFPLHIQFISNP